VQAGLGDFLHDGHGTLADERDWHRMGADAMARGLGRGAAGAGEGRDLMDREAAGRNIQAAIARRREQFYLADLDWNV
jgi:hypothetical protein